MVPKPGLLLPSFNGVKLGGGGEGGFGRWVWGSWVLNSLGVGRFFFGHGEQGRNLVCSRSKTE